MAQLRVPLPVYQALTGLPVVLAGLQRQLAIPAPIKSVTLDGPSVFLGFDAEGFGDAEEVDIRLLDGIGHVAPLPATLTMPTRDDEGEPA